jgi:hypothetical protein
MYSYGGSEKKKNKGIFLTTGEFNSVVTERQGVLFSGQRRQSCYNPSRNGKN